MRLSESSYLIVVYGTVSGRRCTARWSAGRVTGDEDLVGDLLGDRCDDPLEFIRCCERNGDGPVSIAIGGLADAAERDAAEGVS